MRNLTMTQRPDTESGDNAIEFAGERYENWVDRRLFRFYERYGQAVAEPGM